MLSLGIIASSLIADEGLANWSLGASLGTIAPTAGLTFVNGTAILDQAGTGSRYGTDIFASSTLGGATINTPNRIFGANGVALKVGPSTSGTVSIARSADGGQTWSTALQTASATDRIEAAAFASVSGTARWIAPVRGDNDVYLSTDNGASFTLQSNVLGGTARAWTAATRMGSAFAVFNQDVTAYYTSDIGLTWTLRTLPTTIDADARHVDSSADTTMIVTGGSVVYTSGDLVNWTLVGTVAVGTAAWDVDARHLAYGNGNWVLALADTGGIGALNDWGIFYSSNNGSSWSTASISNNDVQNGEYDLAFNSADNGFYALGRSNSLNAYAVWRALS